MCLASQVKDPSKAAHAADADLKELVESRGLEMKKEPFTEAKCSQERYDQASLTAAGSNNASKDFLDTGKLCFAQGV